MLKIIYGPSGSGKSKYIAELMMADAEAQRKAILIVPEQQLFTSEAQILADFPDGAGRFIEVMSFSRLADKVFEKHGGAAHRQLGGGAENLLMWHTVKELMPLLEEYKLSRKTDTSLSSMMLRTVKELSSYSVSPEALDSACESIDADEKFKAKMRDIVLIYASYQNALKDTLGEEFKTALSRLSDVLGANAKDFFGGASVYVDSFTSFTPEEYEILRHIILGAPSVYVTLCCDDSKSSIHFESVYKAKKKLIDIAKRTGAEVKTLYLEKSHRASSPELRSLEENMWSFEKTADTLKIPEGERGNIRLVKAADVYGEAEAVALNVLDLIRSGYKYSDIALVARDAQGYRGILDAAFDQYGIPYFFSEKSSVLSKPAARFIIYTLKIIANGWQYEDVIALLRTGLTPISLRDIDLFEEYCTTWSINGSAFLSEGWSMNPDGYTSRISERAHEILERANVTRKTLTDSILPFASALKSSQNAYEMCSALCEYISSSALLTSLAESAEYELTSGKVKDAGETLRLYDFITSSITDVADVLGDKVLTVSELICALTLVFDATDIASVPALRDCVTVGSASTLRIEDVKVMMMIGLREGEFPMSIRDTGILTKSDKKLLSSIGLELCDADELGASEELLYIYRAASKPSELLYLFTSATSGGGEARGESLFFSRVKYLFNYLEVEGFDKAMIKAPKTADVKETAKDSAFALSPEFLRALMGDNLTLTQSKIQSFKQCPYSFYATYILTLREHKESQIAANDAGTFIHFVLEHFIKSCIGEDGKFSIGSNENERIEEKANAIMLEYMKGISDNIELSKNTRLTHLFYRMRSIAILFIKNTLEEFEHSRFIPKYFEVKIGSSKNSAAAVSFELEGGKSVSLSGKVDRVDIFEDGDKIYFRVIDYKSGSKTFSLDEVINGYDLQLLLYLFALCNGEKFTKDKEGVPAGTLYVSTTSEKGSTVLCRSGILLGERLVLEAMSDTLDPKFLLGAKQGKDGAITGSSLASKEDFDNLNDEINKIIVDVANEIYSGVASKTPSEDACRYCKVKGSCTLAVIKEMKGGR